LTQVRTIQRTATNRRARSLRRTCTRAEAHLWNALRAHRLGGWKWKRQHPFGPFFLDFACVESRIAVEVDGGQHAEQVDYDTRRTAFLTAAGWRVIRFWNTEVLANRDGVCVTILEACGGERSHAD